ncbi:MAG: HAD family phosphatase [Rikenellaceae bacterium]
MIKGVLFDMDGVLVDNMDIHIAAFDKFCTSYGADEVGDRLIACAGMGNEEIMRIMLPKEVIEEKGIDALSVEKEAVYREIYAPTIKPVAGLIDLLKELKAQGVKCAIGSSGCRENVEFVVEKCGLVEYFDAYVYSDLVTRCKPDPEIYLTAAKLLGIEPSEALVFEDALVGIKSARNAKVAKVIALSTTLSAEALKEQSDADEIVTDFRDVLGRTW